MHFVKVLAIILACISVAQAQIPKDFVKIDGTHFTLNGARYYFLGANYWYGMNLGSRKDPSTRARLLRELDKLQNLGITNLRILASTEGPESEPWRIIPVLQPKPKVYDSQILEGLDFLLAELKKRKMLAVVCLNNFWPWSGGMSQYLVWSGAAAIPYPPPQPGGSWSTYQSYTQNFYSNPKAVTLANEFVKMLLNRMNSVNKIRYKEDSTIMAWELANEPRGVRNTEAFNQWIESTSELIKSIDKNHLVTTGVEGETTWPSFNGMNFLKNHSYLNIDYTTIHIWAQNWSWYDPKNPQKTFPEAIEKMKNYFQEHVEKAKRLGKPLVVEEFGLARDGESYDPESTTFYRDQYYKVVFEEVYQSALTASPVSGVNFWAWAGEGRPEKPYGGYWKKGSTFIGDPPHERQGWYSVYSKDQSTIEVIQNYIKKISNVK